jgi:hypothetical protein
MLRMRQENSCCVWGEEDLCKVLFEGGRVMARMEKKIQNKILREFATRSDMRLWRQNVGKAVPLSQIKAIQRAIWHGDIQKAIRLCEDAPVISFGLKGQADLSGILSNGQRLEIEVKDPDGKQSKEQRIFQEVIERFGGKYILATSVNDVEEVIG